MKMVVEFGALAVGLAAMVVLSACSQNPASPSGTAPTVMAEVAATAETSLDPRFNPTMAVGGGINASNVISADDIAAAFKSIPQVSQLKVMANSSPPGAKGADVQSVSVIGQDTSGVLKGLDANGKKALGDAVLTAAGVAWPNAAVSLLITDAASAGGQIIGSHSPGVPNTIIVT